ncbi:phage replisome organizer N-terminal domain-containing protein [Tissierella sp.]|uniref:phage replisome organizer N-terminal domain-containing protein n=1 Tax=Tissierella sp. TaxID=41274 RepID=UPI0037DD6352
MFSKKSLHYHYRDLYHIDETKLRLAVNSNHLSLKHEDQLLLQDDIAYTPQMIATLTNYQSGTVEKALQQFLGQYQNVSFSDNELEQLESELKSVYENISKDFQNI